MKMKLIYIACIILTVCFGNRSSAQNARFIRQGVIEYEKKVNMYALIIKNMGKTPNSFYEQAFDAYKKNQPQFKLLKSILNFSDQKTLFTPVDSKANASQRNFFGDEPSALQNNIIYSDLSAKTSCTQKKVYEETFLIKDKTRKFTWKITDEKRDILGYSCRRANGIMMDSIYVVAFYTDKIPVPGGPESFCGLPGMILGVALPHENITWFATKVSDVPVSPEAVKPPVKGKPMDLEGFKTFLGTALKDWGDYAKAAMKGFIM